MISPPKNLSAHVFSSPVIPQSSSSALYRGKEDLGSLSTPRASYFVSRTSASHVMPQSSSSALYREEGKGLLSTPRTSDFVAQTSASHVMPQSSSSALYREEEGKLLQISLPPSLKCPTPHIRYALPQRSSLDFHVADRVSPSKIVEHIDVDFLYKALGSLNLRILALLSINQLMKTLLGRSSLSRSNQYILFDNSYRDTDGNKRQTAIGNVW
ncbi:hypothetical protein EDD22DRAFT_851661 [Suillus occidentalis]|nr:hypothetical protein EDD22DRAFT_851661 [Suillus occidentalis]